MAVTSGFRAGPVEAGKLTPRRGGRHGGQPSKSGPSRLHFWQSGKQGPLQIGQHACLNAATVCPDGCSFAFLRSLRRDARPLRSTLAAPLTAVWSGPVSPGKLRLVPFPPAQHAPQWSTLTRRARGPHASGTRIVSFPFGTFGLAEPERALRSPISLAAPRGVVHHCLIHSTHLARTVGRFVLSPITRQTDSGQFEASLSIRSGQGSASHDRVFRFIPLFATAQAAALYALDQGLSFLRQPALPA